MERPGPSAAHLEDVNPETTENGTVSRRTFGPAAVFCAWLGFLICLVYFAGALVNAPPPWQRVTSNWDTGWYLTIVNDGYQTAVNGETNLAFFPLYPLVIRLLTKLGPDPVAAGVAFSLTCFLGALFLLRTLVAEKVSEQVARHTLLLLVFWPFSFFFGLVYTESLFLLLVVGAFFFVHRRHWWLAAACAGLAGATRAVGIFVAVAVVLAYFEKEWSPTVKKSATILGLAAAGLSGLGAFMVFLKVHTGDFLAFLEAQRFWPNRANGISGLRSIPTVLQTRPSATWDFALVVIYMVPMVLFVVLCVYVLVKIDVVWGGFCLLALLAPVPTGSLASTNRYVLALFPCFVAAAKLLGDRAVVAAAASAGLLGLFAYHYTYHTGTFIG
ncbi:MAG TPA: mannosyltransferase family protein [Actinomycetota bacterium]|nr:mannosyltransferase family protein [Actinomycetota bacterium]